MFIRFTAIENKMMRKQKIRESVRIIVFLYLIAIAGSSLLTSIPLPMTTKILMFVLNAACSLLLVNKHIKEIVKQTVLGTKEEYEDRVERQLYMMGEKR